MSPGRVSPGVLQKYIKGILNSHAVWHSFFFDTSAVILRKKTKIVGESFFQL